jgi:hypothetical protein
MRRLLAIAALVTLAACGKPEAGTPLLSKDPISVRGWIEDAEGTQTEVKTQETESARKAQLFQSINVWVDGAPYVSGGVAENGSFILLDVPPGNVTVSFAAPGIPEAKLVLQNVPGNSDVLVPQILLRKNGTVAFDTNAVKVRLAAKIDKPRPAKAKVAVNGLHVQVMETPLAQMIDRRDFPNPPGYVQPVATVR